MVLHLDVETLKILTHDFKAFFDVRGGTDVWKHNSDFHFSLLIVECLGEGVGLITVFLQELFDLLTLLLADTGPVMDNLVDSRLCRACQISNLL